MKSIFYSKNIQVESAVMFFTDLLINEAFYYYTLTQLDGAAVAWQRIFFQVALKILLRRFMHIIIERVKFTYNLSLWTCWHVQRARLTSV